MRVLISKELVAELGQEKVKTINKAIQMFFDTYKLEDNYYFYKKLLVLKEKNKETVLGTFFSEKGNAYISVRTDFNQIKLPESVLIETIFHELTHFKQVARRELVTNQTRSFWKGIPFPYLTTESIQKDEKLFHSYKNLPWEVEANEVASKMSTLFYKKEKKTLKEKFKQFFFRLFVNY